MNHLEEIFRLELRDLYDAAQQMRDALLQLRQQASSAELKASLDECERQAGYHIRRLEQAFEYMGDQPERRECKATRGLIEETRDSLDEVGEGDATDALIIAAAQKMAHYEIAAYGTLAAWAKEMDQGEVKNLLGRTLEEKEKTDKQLSRLAERRINERAL